MKMMKVTIKTSCMVKPAEQTWSGKQTLSELDQTGTFGHVPSFYFYTQSPDDWTNFLQTLKASLSSTLVHFYPLAGRLSALPGGRLELDCSAAGARFVEAYADDKLPELDAFSEPSTMTIYDQLITSIDYDNTPYEEIPMLVVQVTRFICGGFCLAYKMSHVVADGQSALHFTTEWARVSRGEALETPPCLDRRVLRAGEPPRASSEARRAYSDPPPRLIGQSGSETEHEKETAVAKLKLTRTQVEKLRKEANNFRTSETAGRGFSRYEVVTAHLWRTACRARKHKPEQPTAVAIAKSVRTTMRPPLPREYFGNAVINAVPSGCSGEIVSKPLGHIASKIRYAVERVDDEHVNSVIDFLKVQQDLSKFREMQPRSNGGGFCGDPNLGVTSWLTLPVLGADFGCGKEVLMTPGTHDTDGDCLLLNGEDGNGSVVVLLCLKARHMGDFHKLFYQDIDE